MHVYMYACMYVYMYVHMFVCMYVCMYVRVCACSYLCMPMYDEVHESSRPLLIHVDVLDLFLAIFLH